MKRRKDILEECPEDFKDELSSWIDEIESEVNDALLNTEKVIDIEDCVSILQDLVEKLY